MVVYVDILLFINTIVNYAILMTAEKLLKRDCRLYRILAGAFVGALFSLLLFWEPDRRWYQLLLRLLSVTLISLVAFGWRSRRECLKAVLMTGAVTALYAGLFILIYQLFRPPHMIIVNDVIYLQVNPLWLTALTALIYLLLLILRKIFFERIKSSVVSLRFTVKSRSYTCIAKIDTGCHLREPFSSAPVIIADSAVFSVNSSEPHRIIPYTALGGSSYLPAMAADSVTIDKKPMRLPIYIASADLHNPHYQAIINSDITG